VQRRLAVLDAVEGEPEWRLHIVELATCKVLPKRVFPAADGKPLPAFIAAGNTGEFWLTSSEATGILIAVSTEGVETAGKKLALGTDAAIPD
jgi:hypothetical protein